MEVGAPYWGTSVHGPQAGVVWKPASASAMSTNLVKGDGVWLAMVAPVSPEKALRRRHKHPAEVVALYRPALIWVPTSQRPAGTVPSAGAASGVFDQVPQL